MSNDQLDAFLAEETGAATASPDPTPAPEPAAAEPTPAETKPEAPKAEAKPEHSDDEDADPAQPLDGEPIVPRRAYEAERRRRQDWKERAARFEGENSELRRQLEAAKAAPAPAPEQPRQRYQPDPATDPVGYQRHIEGELVNHRLNLSELMLRREIGDAAVDTIITDFQDAAKENPQLFPTMWQQLDPYAFARKVAERHRMLRDMGDDPAAFRARIEAEARAKWEAEAASQARTVNVAPALNRQPSLATARSVAGRAEGAWNGEMSLEDALAPVQNRKNTNGVTRRF